MVSSEMPRKELMLLRRFGDAFTSDMDEEGSVLAMDVDDDVGLGVDPLEIFSEPFVPYDSKKLVDRDFFNSFEDDFDDADIN